MPYFGSEQDVPDMQLERGKKARTPNLNSKRKVKTNVCKEICKFLKGRKTTAVRFAVRVLPDRPGLTWIHR